MADLTLKSINLDEYRVKIQQLREEMSSLSTTTDEYAQKQEELVGTTNQLTSEIANSAPTVNELKASLSELKSDWANANDEAERGAIATEIGVVQEQLKVLNQEMKNTAQEAGSVEGSYNSLVVKMRELQQAAKATGDASERMELSRQANEINNQLKGMDAEMGNFQRNVGSYEESITSAFGQIAGAMGPVAKGAGGIGKAIGGLDAPVKIAVGAIGGLSKAFKALKAAIASNPIGLLVTAVVAAGVAIYNHIKSVKEAEEEYKNWKKSLTDISKESKDFAREEQIRSKLLFESAIKAKKGTDERKNAILALQKQYPAYFGNMNAEIATNEDLQDAYRQLASDILKAAEARAKFEKLKDLYKQRDDLREEIEKEVVHRGQLAKIRGNNDYDALDPNSGGFAIDNSVNRVEKRINDLTKKDTELTESINRLEKSYNTEDMNTDVTRDPGTEGDHHRSTGHRRGGGYASVKEEKDEALAALEELRDTYNDFESELQENTSHTLELINQNIGAFTDYTNGIENSGNFEIDQLERKKKAEDKYYTDSSTAQKEYLNKLKQEEEKANADLVNGEKKKDTKLIESAHKRLEIIFKEQEKVRKAQELADAKYYNRQYKTSEAVGDELQKVEDEKVKKFNESYDARLEAAQNAYDLELEINKMRYADEREREEKDKEAQKKYLDAKLHNEAQYLYDLRTILDENEPIITAAKARFYQANNERNSFYNEKDKKKQKDQVKAVIETANAIADLTSSITDYWKNSIQAQLDAGEISAEEAEKQFEKVKAVEIAGAVVSTLAGALSAQMSVWKDESLPLWSKVALSALYGMQTLMSGYATIKQIKDTKIGSSGSGANTITVANATPLLDEAQDVNQLNSYDAVLSSQNNNNRVYILQSDITDSNKQVEVRQKQSTF